MVLNYNSSEIRTCTYMLILLKKDFMDIMEAKWTKIARQMSL